MIFIETSRRAYTERDSTLLTKKAVEGLGGLLKNNEKSTVNLHTFRKAHIHLSTNISLLMESFNQAKRRDTLLAL